jgi:DNA-binding MarR family transcriptional regulator
LTLRENHRSTITEKFGRAAGNGHRVLEFLYEHPILSANEVRDLIGTTYPAANDLVGKFVGNGILREITGQARNRKFMYQSYIDLFRDEAGEVENP